MKHCRRSIFIVGIAFLFACNSDKSAKNDETVKELLSDKPAEVNIVTLASTDFEHELVSNGKISARNIAELKFQTSEVISDIFVKNGSRVEKGQQIAKLDTYVLSIKVNQAKDALDRSKLDYQDVLISQGYKLDNAGAVPKETLELAKVKSGYNTAQTQYDMAVYDLEHTTLKAPISGVIANLFAKPNTLSSPSDVFCNIIDTRSLETTFTVLENELALLQLGDKIKVIPFALPGVEVKGQISEINPLVDKNGMVQVKASVDYSSRLVEGMNVRISIFQSLGKQWVVPKSAVVLRTGKEVVFTLQDGKAIWNYVQTGLENADSYTITSETLKEGDQIIVSGNINLAHESPVKVNSDL
ncbi:MAG TPA: efflux RND transporter periplasmic adaptor subunit [Porphyromonadaceae bacterium]|nr:efflux RND transporter periplasmic adaptor subunit [Porphyromonadaceae bacterium]